MAVGADVAHGAVRDVVPRRHRRAHDDRDGAPPAVDRVDRHRARSPSRRCVWMGPAARARARAGRLGRVGRLAQLLRAVDGPRGARHRAPRAAAARGIRVAGVAGRAASASAACRCSRRSRSPGPCSRGPSRTGGELDRRTTGSRRASPRAGCATRCADRGCSTTTCAPSSNARADAARPSPCSTRADSTDSTRQSLAVIRAQLAETLRSARSDRLYIRTSPHETRRGHGRRALRRRRAGLSDEDAVDLWREIPHPQRRTDAPRAGARYLAPRPGGGGEPGRGAESEEARGGEAARPSPSGRLPENRPRGRTWDRRRAETGSAERRSVPAVPVSASGMPAASVGISGDKDPGARRAAHPERDQPRPQPSSRRSGSRRRALRERPRRCGARDSSATAVGGLARVGLADDGDERRELLLGGRAAAARRS